LDQVRQYNPPSNFAKEADPRFKGYVEGVHRIIQTKSPVLGVLLRLLRLLRGEAAFPTSSGHYPLGDRGS